MNRRFNNRAVSNIIAALLLIAIAVAAAVLLYVFSIGLLGSLGSSGGQQTKEQLTLEAFSWPSDCTSLDATIRNVGPATISIDSADAFVNGIPASLSSADSDLAPHESTSITLDTGSGTYVLGASYPLKIVTATGGVFSYSVICGGAN